MEPQPWPGAEDPPFNNVIGIDPELVDPENWDFRLAPGSPAEGYGCQSFPPGGIRSRLGRDRAMLVDTPTEWPARRRERLEVSGLIESDTSWEADTILVTGDVEIMDGVTLAIAAGARVEFLGHYALTVQGRLLALGTPEDWILFTSADPGAFQIDSTLAGAWNGLRFEGTPSSNDDSRLEHCVVEYCKAVRDTAFVGPLVLDRFSGLRVINSVIRHNVADYGGALFCMAGAAPRLIGCLITDNYAFEGGGAIYCLDAYPRLIACTLTLNHDLNPEPFDPAAALLSFHSKPQTLGSILWQNSTYYFLPSQFYEAKSYYTRFNDIDGGYAGEGNFDLDPLFLGAGDHPFSLKADSPCVNAGCPDSTGLGLPAFDPAGSPRIMGGRLDTGAYEGNPETDAIATVPGTLRLHPNHPNPFNPSTRIRFTLPRVAQVRLDVLDARGRRVATLVNQELPAGTHSRSWRGRDARGRPAACGVYICRLRDDRGAVACQKLLLLK